MLQYPFADLRSFIGEDAGRLNRPSFPIAEPGKDFIRSSGLVKYRRRGGVEEWAGEELYGDASLAFRFPNHLGKAKFGTGTVEATVGRTFRRFHSDGTVARVEVGFKLCVENNTSTTSSTDWVTLLRDVLSIPVRVRHTMKQPQAIKLVEAGDALAQHYLAATTDRRLTTQVHPQAWWFSAGIPALIVEYPNWRSVMLPPHSRFVLEVPEADAMLSHAWLQFGNLRCSAWFVAKGDGDPDAIRRLRIHLARLHAERECLKLILLSIKNNDKLNLAKNLDRSDIVQQYLNDAIRTIQKPERFGLAQSDMFDAALQALGIAFEGQATSLQFMRRQVTAKIEGYIHRAQNTATVINNIQGDVMNTSIQFGNVSVTGDFNLITAKNIQNSFNKAANADVNDNLKEKLKSLAIEVADLAKKLPQEDAEKVSKDLDTLTSEAISNKPRKEWYELSAKGILEAAKSVAKISVPITTAVKAVLALLA